MAARATALAKAACVASGRAVPAGDGTHIGFFLKSFLEAVAVVQTGEHIGGLLGELLR